jgi:formamidopyrimidine-DNA glycosylase
VDVLSGSRVSAIAEAGRGYGSGMPELSDVEGFARVARRAAGHRVTGIKALGADVLRNTSAQGLGRALKGRELGQPTRHGKWLIVPAGDGPVLVLHFGMTGSLHWRAEPHDRDKVVIDTDGGELRYRTLRKLGGVWLARSEGERDEITGPLGPDALGLDEQDLRAALESSRGALKPAMTSQPKLAGIGNLLADEILWRARLHPRIPVRDLDDGAWSALASCMAHVLEASVPEGRVPPFDDWLTGARDDDDPHCPRCATALDHATVGGRSTWWCPQCQPS